MKTLRIPDIEGVEAITPLEMNNVKIEKRHTMLSPRLLAEMRTRVTKRAADDNHDGPSSVGK
ncbi:MAG: hypothetical protein ACI31E_07150 [Muribaculaceae bacterium]